MKLKFINAGMLTCVYLAVLSGITYSQMEYHPGGETFIILIDGTTRLYDPNVDYGKLNLKMPADANYRNPLPEGYLANLKKSNLEKYGTEGCSLTVNYNNFTAQAQTAFQYAVDIWQAHVNSPVPINTYASWEPMGTGVLGSSTRMGAYRDFTGAPRANTWFPVALAESIFGSVMNGTGYDIYVRFNSDFQWYLGTDGKTPSGQYDFVSIVLHELCHGLGFYGSFSFSGGTGYWGSSGYPFIWDVGIENGAGEILINTYTSGTTALGTQITSNNIFYNRPNAVANNGGTRVSIYAPSTWSGGSSMVHVGNIYNGTRNSLMTYAASPAYSEHSPGPITMGMLRDFGWSVANIPPERISLMPDFSLAQNSDNVFYGKMSDYFYDVNQYRITNFNITGSGNVACEIRNDSLFLTASTAFTGFDTVYFTANDSGMLSVADTILVTVVAPQPALDRILYAAGTTASGGLVTLNVSTGSPTTIGATGFSDIKGLAIEPNTHEMYGLFVASTYGKLLRIDASAGKAYEYRIIPGSSYRSIAFDKNGDLYICTTTGILRKVAIQSGDTTFIGSTGLANLQYIAINTLTGQLYGLITGGTVYKIDKTTASAVSIGTTGFGTARALAFDNDGILYGLSGGTNQPLYRIDTTTAAGTLIGNTGKTGLSALAIWGSSVGIEDESPITANTFSLYQNYPNPFNPTTTIRYTLAANEKVALKIYNTLGQEVRTLLNGQAQTANRAYEIVWDGKDNKGSAVSSGIYLYRLEAGSFVKTRKMMLLK